MLALNQGRPKILLLLLVLSFVLCHHLPARAQVACPPGMIPYGTGANQSVCGEDPSYQSPSIPAPQPQAPPVKWASRWGAVATDGHRGTLGVASDMSSQSSAEKQAMKDCKDKGGEQCVLDVSYGNSCVAMIVGDRGYSVKTGRTPEEAIGFAAKSCSASGDNCRRVYYTNCSLAIRTQ
ncbi:DUF4189 domain-containing protein [Burkholderia sp. AU38729]|uniref:DUF4189 domain-containing protein n=1 Tax=Burkholderia sp. AU38729 TaxID=2879633 RepID=UPI001CF2E2BF|nr:DUF4189 domain-containing protein [Burkholderia sp. AU38729]MCA8064050.1 DUF4189 domain-containing protein [Burkholderia sp. AU38729]